MQMESTVVKGSRLEICIDKFLHYFPGGFNDPNYIETQRKDTWKAHSLWQKTLSRTQYTDLLNKGQYAQISSDAVRIASKPELLNPCGKKALRDAVKSEGGARLFAIGLYNYLYGQGSRPHHFHTLTRVLETIPHKQVSLLTWPAQTVFGFIARPARFLFVSPAITIKAAEKYGYGIQYSHRPNWNTYQSVIDFTSHVVKEIKKLKPRDMIDLHAFFSVLVSEAYPALPDVDS